MKNKILDNLPIIFVALVFVFGMTLTWNHAKANPREMAQFPWTYQQMLNLKTICKTIRYLKQKHLISTGHKCQQFVRQDQR